MAEKEGEFKKRLSKGKVMVGEPHETGWYQDEGYTDDWEVVDDLVVFPRDEILKVLDEAKAEFPLDTNYPDLLFTDRNIVLSGQRLIWFKKWFGSSEKL